MKNLPPVTMPGAFLLDSCSPEAFSVRVSAGLMPKFLLEPQEQRSEGILCVLLLIHALLLDVLLNGLEGKVLLGINHVSLLLTSG